MYAHVYVHVWIKTHAKKGKGPWISKTIGKWLAAVEIGAFAMQIHAKQQLIVQAVFSRLPRLHSLPYALPSITCYSESCVWTVWTERERERERKRERERASLPNRLANHLWRNWAEGRSHPPHFWFPDCLKKTQKPENLYHPCSISKVDLLYSPQPAKPRNCCLGGSYEAWRVTHPVSFSM